MEAHTDGKRSIILNLFLKTAASVTGKAKHIELLVLFALQLGVRGLGLERWTEGQPACTKRSHETRRQVLLNV